MARHRPAVEGVWLVRSPKEGGAELIADVREHLEAALGDDEEPVPHRRLVAVPVAASSVVPDGPP